MSNNDINGLTYLGNGVAPSPADMIPVLTGAFGGSFYFVGKFRSF